MKQQLQTGNIEMPTIGSTLRESGAVDVTLEEHTEREQEEATTDEKTIEQGVQTIVKVVIHEPVSYTHLTLPTIYSV